MSPKSNAPAGSWLDAIRRDWDTRARENPRAYINWPGVANDEDAFFASGRNDYELYVTPFLRKMQFNPQNKVALEIGCGIGRLGRRMVEDFGEYIGVDVSPEMIRKASSYGLPRATFRAVSGGDLAGIPDSSVDFVLSFAVFQHVPDKDAIFSYFAETARVLRPGGVFRLHMKGLWTLAFGRFVLEGGFSNNRQVLRAGLTKIPFARVRYLDTWQGHSIRPGEAIAKCKAFGLKVLDTQGEWTTMMWVGGRKQRELHTTAGS